MIHRIVCGLMRHVRESGRPDIDFFKNLASYPGCVGGGKRGLVYTVCACASCVRELTVKDFVNSRLLNRMNMLAKNADFTFLSV